MDLSMHESRRFSRAGSETELCHAILSNKNMQQTRALFVRYSIDFPSRAKRWNLLIPLQNFVSQPNW